MNFKASKLATAALFPVCAILGLMLIVGLKVGLAEEPKPPRPAVPDFKAEMVKRFDYSQPPADWEIWASNPTVPAPTIEVSLHIDAPELPARMRMIAEDVADAQPATSVLPPIESLPIASNWRKRAKPGELIQAEWWAGETMHGASLSTPVLVATGKEPGPRLCVTAAVHGDELNGIEAVRQLMHTVRLDKLQGQLVGVPIVNLQGFQRQSRYLSDRRDLNRYFPGNPRGSAASRLAHAFFNEVILYCDGLVDLHTGSFHRTNLPQLRADLDNPAILDLTRGFGSTTILHSPGGLGTLRRAASDAGVPAVTLEAGEPLRLQQDEVDHVVKALFTLLDTLGMYQKRGIWGNPEPTYYSSAWVRADQGGILLSAVKLGRSVKEGDLLGTVTDPITNEEVAIYAPFRGRVIGMAVNQFVMPGYAAFHLASAAPIDEVLEEEPPVGHAGDVEIAVHESLGDEASEE